MVQGRFLTYQEDLSDAFHIRREVFVKEQGIPEDLEFDCEDKKALHVIIYEGSMAVATGRLVFQNGEAMIGRVAVLKEYRGKKYGDLVMRMLLDKAISKEISSIYLHAEQTAEGFYEKLGFYKEGEAFIEAGIHHIKMKYNLSHNTFCCNKLQEL